MSLTGAPSRRSDISMSHDRFPALAVDARTLPNNALQLTAYSLRCGFRQQLKAGVRTSEFGTGEEMFLKLLLLLIISVLFSSPAFGQAVTVFKGQPTVKISQGGVSRLPNNFRTIKRSILSALLAKSVESTIGLRERTKSCCGRRGAHLSLLSPEMALEPSESSNQA